MSDVLEPGGPLASAIPHYEDRPGQRQMSEAVARALEERRGLLVEAGTGIGKTLAYLVPALQSGQRVVVSTGTRALQDQIARNDLPLLRELLARPFNAVVLKGISNYVCKRKLADLVADRRDDRGIFDWAGETATGDRAEVAWLGEEDAWWSEVTTTSETRLGARCPYFNACFVTQARRAAEKANLILVNHHLYFADLAIRASGGTSRILPEHDAVIFDEAHQLEDVATEHFGVRFSSNQLGALLRDAQGLMGKMALFTGGEVSMPLRTAERAGIALFAGVRAQLLPALLEAQGGGHGAAAEHGRVTLPPGLFDDQDRQQVWFELDAALEEIARGAESEAEDGPDEETATTAARGGLGQIAFRARAMRDALALVAEQRQASYVYWGEARSHATALTASPIRVAELISRHVVRAGPTPIFTSATLSTGGSMAYSRRRLGLSVAEIDELIVESPFDYGRCAQLYVPRDLPGPDDPAFTAAAAARIRELVALTGGGAFVLCTSHRSMAALAAALVDLPHPRLVQGEAPRGLLVDRFRSTPGSVLFGCGSFWEGVDVPGEALRLVIIDRLPFTPHVDPLQAARLRSAAEAGVEPFAAISLPEAAIALKQGFGRLIRRSDDRGIVAILDGRVVTRSYGRVFFDTLPARLPRTSSLEQVRRWWRGERGDEPAERAALATSEAGGRSIVRLADPGDERRPGEGPEDLAPRASRARPRLLTAAAMRTLVETLAARAREQPRARAGASAASGAAAAALDQELEAAEPDDFPPSPDADKL